MTSGRRSALVGAYATFAVFTVLAGQFWRNLLGWWGFGAVVAVVVAGAIWLIVATRPSWAWRRVPKSTLAFLAIATLSVAWSAYPASSALGVAILLITAFVAITLALCLSWSRLVTAIAGAVKWVLGLSLVFELVIAIFVRQPVPPLFPDYDPSDYERVPLAFFWSRALLFDGGPIEGIVANRNLLGMIALIGVIVFGALLASGAMRRAQGIGWLVVAGVTLVLTRSATVTLVAALVVIGVAFVAWARRAGPDRRRPVYLTAGLALVASVTALVVWWSQLTSLLGRSEDVTGRFEIWAGVTELAAQRPLFGWGWLGYWQPWTEPLNSLYSRHGVIYLQAHNAWLDVWLQLGILGLVAFASVVIGALWRSWFLAVDRPMDASGRLRPHTAASLVPLALMIALIGQSLAESRLLLEGNLVLLLAIAWATKQRQWAPEPLPVEPARARFDRRPTSGTASAR
ncbi:O-antigen ligase family protein [Agromyces aerolatus]|uniref:O-antigen ligase family protein n=1 Tax=Agromyces sp. LY-1074 TaxID=3074080 RepID=UPI002860D74D|nr:MULTISPECIES: O-antigen ligase family protein [unclassified Agromyces]MDR5700389.1 O-antigen ligase family protein [Agromyces sp. LY-1074]MDR5706633.1 O-antigen ligase family protein [Agromyces sp. LY-1358]